MCVLQTHMYYVHAYVHTYLCTYVHVRTYIMVEMCIHVYVCTHTSLYGGTISLLTGQAVPVVNKKRTSFWNVLHTIQSREQPKGSVVVCCYLCSVCTYVRMLLYVCMNSLCMLAKCIIGLFV